MAWTQTYDPLHSWILSTLVAALPILVLFGLLAGLRVRPHWCAIAGAVTATTTAVPAPAMAHQCGLTLSPASRPNSTRIGKAATRVERIQLCNGSYVWVQAMGHPWGVG